MNNDNFYKNVYNTVNYAISKSDSVGDYSIHNI